MSFQYPLPKGIRQVVPDYVCDGVNMPAVPVPFRFLDPTDIWIGWQPAGEPGVYFVAKTLNVDYELFGQGLEAGGTATFITLPAAGLIRVMGLRTPSRVTSVVNDGEIIATAMENELDLWEMTAQELRRDVNNLQSALESFLQADNVLQNDVIPLQALAQQVQSLIGGGVPAETARAEAAETAETARALAAEAALFALIAPLLSVVSSALSTVFMTPSALPTTAPGGAGLFWNDGGMLAVTPGGPNPLPTAQPATPGLYWNNGGLVAIS